MIRKNMLHTLIAILMVAGLAACSTQTVVQPTATTAPVATEEVAAVAPTETATAEPTVAPTEAPTSTPLPTATLEPTATSETVVQPVVAEVASGSDAYVTLSANTVCREGPATVYHSVVTIPAGLKVKAVGKLADSDIYYYIENPNAAGTYCWVYAQGATIEGNANGLNNVIPQPSPTPDSNMNFSITYSRIKQCGDDYSFSFIVTNTDDLVWQSIKVYIVDVKTLVTANYWANRFEEYSNCKLDNYQGDLAKGERVYMTPYNPGHFDYSPYGGTFLIRVTLCSEKDLAGTCLTKEIKARP